MDVAALITALGAFAAAVIGALVLLCRLLVDVHRVKSSLSPNGGGSLHDAIRRTEHRLGELADAIDQDRTAHRAEHRRLWAAIDHPNPIRRLWRKP